MSDLNKPSGETFLSGNSSLIKQEDRIRLSIVKVFDHLKVSMGLLEHRQDKDAQEYCELLCNYKVLVQAEPHEALTRLLIMIKKLTELLDDHIIIQEVDNSYCEIVQLYSDLTIDDPETYLSDMAYSLFMLARFRHKNLRFEEAERKYNESLRIYRRLALDESIKNRIAVAVVLIDLAALRQETKSEIELSLQCVNEALALLYPAKYYEDAIIDALKVIRGWNLDVKKYLRWRGFHHLTYLIDYLDRGIYPDYSSEEI